GSKPKRLIICVPSGVRGSRTNLPENFAGPAAQIEAVSAEQSERHALQTEADAGTVGNAAVVHLNPKCRAEVFVMQVEGRNRGSASCCDGDHSFVLESQFALIVRKEFAFAPEERVGCGRDCRIELAQLEDTPRAGDPGFAPRLNFIGLADADQFALVEHLETRGIAGRLVTENVAIAEIECDAAFG